LIGILVLFFFLNYLTIFENSKGNDHSLKKLSIIDNDEEVQNGLMKKINQNIREKMTLITVYDKEALFFLYTIKNKRLLLHFPNKGPHLKNDIPYDMITFLKDIIKSKKIFLSDNLDKNIRKYGLFKEDILLNGLIVKPILIDGNVTGIIGIATSKEKEFSRNAKFYEMYLNDIIDYLLEINVYKKLLKEKNEFLFFYKALERLNRLNRIKDISVEFYSHLSNIFTITNYNFIEIADRGYRIIDSTSDTAIINKWFTTEERSFLNRIGNEKDMKILRLDKDKIVKLNISGSVESHFDTNYIITMPIRTKIGKFLLVLLEIKVKKLSENEKRMLRIMEDNLTQIIENRSLLERFANLANYDGLTEIYNHKKFQETFDDILKRSKSPRRDFCVIMFDIDFFKRFNDTYGHRVGDIVLKKVASSIKKSVKDNDIVARYGGEEFIVIVCDTDLNTGLEIAERIRKNIDNIRIDHKKDILRITISGGISHYPSMGLDKSTLIGKADKALYKAKNDGRNRIAIL
jgi:diguanylate cyclase (GGDEF)-like protein